MTDPTPRDPSSAPFVTYITAAFNAAETLPRALDSLLAQDDPGWESIIVDDGSADNTLEIARRYASHDARFSVLARENSGVARARNAAAETARGRYIAILDADDELDPSHLSRMLRLVRRHPGRQIFSSDGNFVDVSGSSEPIFGYQGEASISLEQELHRSLILGGGTLIDAEAFHALGGFRPTVYCEDYDLWLRALAAGMKHVATDERLYHYHLGVAGQKSTDRVSSIQGAIDAIQDLLETSSLTEPQRVTACEALADYRRDLTMELQAASLARIVSRVFGERSAPRVLTLVHRVSWVTRPLRRWLARG